MRIGLFLNPIAGLGGPAGLKGSDAHWQEALDAGYAPKAQERAAQLAALLHDGVVTVPGCMGVPGHETIQVEVPEFGETCAADTGRIAQALAQTCDVVCFVGGDGTATDVAAALPDHPSLGIPGGVKITSPVFAHDLHEAAWILNHLEDGFATTVRDVTDLDEAAYRDGRLNVRLTGSLTVPLSPAIQSGKAPVGEVPLDGLVEHALHGWNPDALHLVGAGSVCMALKKRFEGDATLLGVDAIQGNRIVASDLDAHAIEALVAKHDCVELWLSIIGGQGMLLGRGTQVLSPAALETIGWDNLHVIAPPEKLLGLRGLHIDSGDAHFDAKAPRYLRIVSGWNETRMAKVLQPADLESE